MVVVVLVGMEAFGLVGSETVCILGHSTRQSSLVFSRFLDVLRSCDETLNGIVLEDFQKSTDNFFLSQYYTIFFTSVISGEHEEPPESRRTVSTSHTSSTSPITIEYSSGTFSFRPHRVGDPVGH